MQGRREREAVVVFSLKTQESVTIVENKGTSSSTAVSGNKKGVQDDETSKTKFNPNNLNSQSYEQNLFLQQLSANLRSLASRNFTNSQDAQQRIDKDRQQQGSFGNGNQSFQF